MFPRHVYKDGGNIQRAGGSYSSMLVEDDKELKEALNRGWFYSLPEAIEGVHSEESNAPPTREELEKKANELGIKFDGRTNDAKLMAKIEEAIKG